MLYRDRLPWWQFAGLVPLILLAAGGLTVLLAPLGAAILSRYFAWLLTSALTTTDLHVYSRSTLIGSYLVFVLMIVVTAPILEELYFVRRVEVEGIRETPGFQQVSNTLQQASISHLAQLQPLLRCRSSVLTACDER